MSELDYVEALNNKELRAECIKYGLPNVPVTDSSRKVLIRRLRAVIDGPAAATSPKAANRRETLPKPQTHTIEVVDAVARNRRTTANTSASFDGRTRSTPVPTTVEARRGINATRSGSDLSAFATPSRSRSVSLSKSDVVTTSYRQELEQSLPEEMEVDEDIINLVDSDEHEYDRTRYNYLNTQKPSPRLPFEPQTARSPQAPRSRSVSLSKSGVVTTSYVQEIVPLSSKVHDEYDEENDDNNFMDDVDDAHNSYYKQSSKTSVPTFRTPILNSTRYSGLDTTVPNRSYSTAASPSSLHSSNVASTYVSYEEQHSADEVEDEPETGQSSDDQYQQQQLGKKTYKSKFTRQLAQQQRNTAEHKPERRRATHDADDENSLENSLRQFIAALDRKYNLKQWIMLLVGLLLAVFLYVMFIEK